MNIDLAKHLYEHDIHVVPKIAVSLFRLRKCATLQAMEATENAPAMDLEAQVEMPVMAVMPSITMTNTTDLVGTLDTVVTEVVEMAMTAEMLEMADTEILQA